MKNQVSKFIALCAIVCGSFACANAQDAPATSPTPAAAPMMGKMNADQRIEMRLNKMKQDLNLTPDQVAKVKPLLQNEMASMKDAKTPEARKENHEKMTAEMGKILTPDQMTKYQNMGHGMRPAGGVPPTPTGK